jgi:hypothetical protein
MPFSNKGAPLAPTRDNTCLGLLDGERVAVEHVRVVGDEDKGIFDRLDLVCKLHQLQRPAYGGARRGDKAGRDEAIKRGKTRG